MTIVSCYGDPDDLDRLARRLCAAADRVREESRALRAGARTIRWRGAAAEAFHRALDDDVARLARAATGLDDAAAALRRHAAAVREMLARIRAAQAAVTGWFTVQERVVRDASRQVGTRVLGAVTASAHALGEALSEPPWLTWPWSPDRLPADGAAEWLAVAGFLRRQGVDW